MYFGLILMYNLFKVCFVHPIFREERKLKEEEFQDQLKLKDQKYIQLWKEYCEYKIKKY